MQCWGIESFGENISSYRNNFDLVRSSEKLSREKYVFIENFLVIEFMGLPSKFFFPTKIFKVHQSL